ncbi:MAG: hypothetical protein K6T31_10860 [Alicyclobacillus sp.]|nr:hypothetical protein [Alicyclobacillus sp.]
MRELFQCVEHPIPDADKATFTYQLSHLYAEYDHGQSLTIVYVNPQTHRQVPIAEAQYDDDNHRLTLTLTLDNGQTVTQTQTVDW